MRQLNVGIIHVRPSLSLWIYVFEGADEVLSTGHPLFFFLLFQFHPCFHFISQCLTLAMVY